MEINSFQQKIANLTCRRIIEENHPDVILSLLEERPHDGIIRYMAAVSSTQVNIYDNENRNSGLGFFAHYVVEKTPYFKGGHCTCACWLYSQSNSHRDSILAVGTTMGEVFLLSCVECRIIGILSSNHNIPIKSLSASPSYPFLLVGLNIDGNAFVWNTETSDIMFQIMDVYISDVICESDNALLYLGSKQFGILDLNSFIFRSIASTIGDVFKDEVLLALLSCKKQQKWILLFSTRFVFIHQQSLKVEEVPLSVPVSDYICKSRVSISRDDEHICITEHQRVHIFTLEGVEEGEIVDNYGIGAQTVKDQNAYKKLPLSAFILHPEAKYAVATEDNRVLRYDMLDPNTRYVSHVIFPHPVEDMFVFYNNLNAEPLLYLNPKIKKN